MSDADPTPRPSPYMTIIEAHELFPAVARRTVRRWADEGKFGKVRRTPGGHRRLERAGVEAYTQQYRNDLLARVQKLTEHAEQVTP